MALLLDPIPAHGYSHAATSQPSSSGAARSGASAGQVARLPSPSAEPLGAARLTGSDGAAVESPANPAAENPPMTVSDPLSGAAFPGLPQVGAIFSYDDSSTGSHFCTGSVVNSAAGDVIVTAAHCVYDSGSGTYINDIAFVPGYHDGQEPYGIWTASKIVVPQQWTDAGDPDYDVAFVVVHQPGSSARIQDVVGADTLGIDPSYTAMARVVGYPSGTEQPITCTNQTVEFSPTQLEFDCAGYPDGTSGSPFLTGVDAQTGLGTVSGVIGGYQYGGDTPDVSYSAYFGSDVADLLTQAQAAG
jgi:V8-like Glu-specific endopeptidase